MHDRAVRRRRAVLVALVAASLILLTAYYGESQDGRLHSVQRGALAALSPIQEGASRVLKPFRDLFGWFGDTVDAKDERDKRDRRARRGPRTQLAAAMNQLREAQQQGKIKDDRHDRRHGQVRPRRRARHDPLLQQLVPALRDQQGHRRRRPPRRPGDQRRRARRQGRDGDRRHVGRDADHRPRVRDRRHRRRRAGAGHRRARRQPRPASCCSSSSTTPTRCASDDLVYTAGTTVSRLESRYPRAIPIGRVTQHRPRRRRARPPRADHARGRPQARRHGAGPDRARTPTWTTP